MAKEIVVVGAGYAGILTAKKLARRFKKAKKQDLVNIHIIDRHPYHTMLTELHEVAANRVEEDSIKMSIKRIFSGRRVNVIMDTITSIDFKAKLIHGENKDYPYDIVVIAAGSKPTFFGVKGAPEYARTFWSYDDAVNLKAHILEMFRAAAVCSDEALRRKFLTFHIVGAGFTGVELAGEIAEWKPILCKEFEIDPDEVSIFDVDVLPRPIPNLPEKQSNKVLKRFEKMGIVPLMATNVIEVGPESITLKKDEKTETYDSRTVVWAAGIESSDLTTDCSHKIAGPERGRGRIHVTPYLNSPDDENVYIVGDNMFYIQEGEKRPVAQMVENCEQCSSCCADNIIAQVTGEGEKRPYVFKGHGVMVSIGGRYGVAYIGGPNKKISLASFFAMFVKHFINVIYFIQVLGWNKVFSYIRHEFFTIRHRRSFLGGHFSNVTPSFLLVLLRLWVGAVWVYEGVMKIVEGWFQGAKLDAFFKGAAQFFDKIIAGAGSAASATAQAATGATAQAADAASSASSATGSAGQAAAAVGQTLLNWNFGLFHLQMVSSKALAASTLNDIAVRLDVPLVNTMINGIVLASPGMQIFSQSMVVIFEILFGLGLMGGCFTFLSAAATLVLQLMFLCTTGLYLSSLWMLFASIAMFFGAGYTLGIDYYLQPALKRHWKNVGWVRKAYLYHD